MSNTGSAVATITSGANTPNPTIVFDSSGNFYIVATVSPSLNYFGTTLTSLQITVYPDTPNIEFSSLVTSQSPYTYKFGDSYEFNGDAAATVTNNTGQLTGQTLIYQIVTADSTTSSLTPSTVATIDPTGWFLNTVSCGTTGTSTFRICATADALGDYGHNVALSDVLTIIKADPEIHQYPQIILPQGVTASTLVYGQPYTITPDPSQISTSIITSNTDEPVITYSTSDSTIATISGITVTLVKVGHFQIMTTVNSTTNYNQIFRSPSTQIYDIIQAVPTIQNFPTTALSAQTWVFGQPYSGIIPTPTSILTSNNDINPPHISYSTSNSTIATISGNTINITGVGYFQILVNISETDNFSAVRYTYPSELVYKNPPPSGVTYTSYKAGPATPIITFPLPPTFVTSATFGSTYIFVPPSLTNSDSTQTLTYSVYPAGSTVSTMMGSASSPSFVLNSVGTFQIQAFCGAPTNNNQYNYFALPLNPLSPILSPTITVSLEMPIIEFIPFNTANFLSQYTCQPSSPYSFSGPIASITNNTVQKLTYSIVATDGVTPSTIATISSDGTSLTTNSVGYFQILATPTDPITSTIGDYGGNSQPSETIKIVSATPTIITFPTIIPTISSLSPLPPQFIYGNTYTIPFTTSPPYPIVTTNTDTAPGPSITYSSTNSAIATITTDPAVANTSGGVTCLPNTAIFSITGTTITINSVGPFQILVTIGATTNYNPVTYTYPSGLVYTAGLTYTSYNAIQATATISPFPSNFGSGWDVEGSYPLLNSVNVTTNAGFGYTDSNNVIYSLVTSNNTVKMVAVGNGGTNAIAYSYDGINWTGLGNSNNIISNTNCVAWNGNMWMVGSSSSPYIIYSLNGINWFPSSNASTIFTTVNGIASNGNMWVAVGQGTNTIAYSYDGIFWNSASAVNIFSVANGIAFNGSSSAPMWVAVGSGENTLAYSSNGINWNISGASNGIFSYNGFDVAFNGSTSYPWVAVGSGINTIAYSSDGINWNGVSNSLSNIFTANGRGVAWNGSIWVAVGAGNNSMAYSPDGQNWTGSNNSTGIISSTANGIAWSGSLWVVVGAYNNVSGYTMAYSEDGNNWTGVTNSVSSIFPNGAGLGVASTTLVPNIITPPNPVIVALAFIPSPSGYYSTIFYSNDGVNWNPAYGAYGINNNNYSGTIFSLWGAGVAWNGSMWVAVGAGNNTIAYSINGQYWYPSNSSTSIFSTSGNDIAWNGSIWVAVGAGQNTIAYSPDGINWTGAGMPFLSSGNGIAWNGSIWVAVGSGTSNTIAYSTDVSGNIWTGSNNSTTIFSTSGNGIAWNGDMWVAVGAGTSNTIAYSPDGINWTGATNSISGGNTTTIFSTSGNNVGWNGLMWVAVGSGTNNTIAYSYDGKEWTGAGNSIFSLSGYGVTWYKAYNTWIAVGNGTSNTIAYSSDGINWKGSSNPTSIFPATGSYGMGIASTSGVVFYTNQGNANNIATITTTKTKSSFLQQITIKDVGSFQLQAEMAATSNFLPALPVQSNTISTIPSNVSITYNFANLGCVYGGGPYTLPSNPTNNTDPTPIITYLIVPQSGSTGNGTISTSNGITQLTITAAGGAYIYVNIAATQNFNAANLAAFVYIAPAVQTIVLNSGWISSNIYTSTIGSSFGCYDFILYNQSNNPSPSYSFTVIQQGAINIVNVASDYEITCVSPGTFYLNITAAETTNYSKATVTTPSFYVSVVPEVIIYNNPQTWPPQASVTGEVGMAICITDDSYPFGFNNYSALTITNVSQNGATFTLNSTTTPTYNSVIYKYMVFFEPATAAIFSDVLSTSTASNIGYTGRQAIASGMSTGQNLTFTFTGNTVGQGFPDPLIINWNPGSLDLSQGMVYGAYYPYANNITPSQNLPNGPGVTVSTLNSGGITGYYIAPWAGYTNTLFQTSTTSGIPALTTLGFTNIQQAWGVWVNINYGDQFGSTITFDNVNYCYVGIPQLTNPITYNP
jgi:hypothetical protein